MQSAEVVPQIMPCHPGLAARRWFALLYGLFAIGPLASAETRPPITTIREIRALTLDQAAAELPVSLKAVVTYSKPSIATLFVNDGTGGIFVDQPPRPDAAGPKPGDQVSIIGATHPGLFATVVNGVGKTDAKVTVLGSAELPPPKEITIKELQDPALDSEWVTLETWVREVFMKNGDLILACTSDNFDFHILLEGPLPPISVPWDLTESRIKARGVVASTFNRGRQMTARFLRVSSLSDITPMVAETDASGKTPLVRAGELLRTDGPGPGELVRVRGISTLTLPGQGLFLQVDEGGLWVQTAQPVAAAPGTVLEVEGWPRMGGMKPFIRARKVSILGSTSAPAAIPLKAADALKADHDAKWIRVEGDLLNSFHGPEGTTLELRDADLLFRALIPVRKDSNPPRISPGSRLRVTGISRIASTGSYILRLEDDLLILASSPTDVEILAPPPFWTSRNVTLASSAIIAALLAFYGIARARRRREQITQRREFEAVLAERGRFAREIHDSLAQGLTSISMQLECVRDQMGDNPVSAADHVERARALVRDSLREARRTIWNLRPLALGESDLATALQRYATHLSDGGRISCRQEIEGTPYPLPPGHEDALLRIGQEAITNAVRHAAATEVRHRLRFGPGWITLTIVDNGVGFDVADRAGKGFGLTSMRERVAALGGSLSIDSRPGKGTEVSATLPT
jgi:signal transduction histidine kinase